MTYKDYDVLEVEPNGIMQWNETVTAPVYELAVRTGAFRNRRKSPTTFVDRPFEWFLSSRSEVATFMEWFHARRGRANPFWTPTWRWDMVVSTAADATDTELRIRSHGYVVNQFPYLARRHLALMSPAREIHTAEVSGAIVSGNEEVLTLMEPLPFDIRKGVGVSLLVFCRLAQDNVIVHWHTQHLAVATARFKELPNELP